jgi:diacylglycerol kinase family enzyme
MYYYIVNPAAGNSIISSIQEKLKSNLHSLGIDGEFNKTIGAGDAAKIAKLAVEQNFKTIVAVGGDETVNEVITAVHATKKTNVAVGIIPTGKQNLMARHLGIGDWQHACDVLAARRLQTYQLMKINSKAFIYDCTFLSEGTWQPEETSSSSAPVWQNLMEKVSIPVAQKPFEYLLDLDNQYKVRGNANQITISNQKFLDTSLPNRLIIHIYNAASHDDKPTILNKIFRRSKPNMHSVSQLHGNNIAIECKSPTEAIIDGQKLGGTKFNIHITDAKVQLITNRETSATDLKSSQSET